MRVQNGVLRGQAVAAPVAQACLSAEYKRSRWGFCLKTCAWHGHHGWSDVIGFLRRRRVVQGRCASNRTRPIRRAEIGYRGWRESKQQLTRKGRRISRAAGHRARLEKMMRWRFAVSPASVRLLGLTLFERRERIRTPHCSGSTRATGVRQGSTQVLQTR